MNPITPEDQYEMLEGNENIHRVLRTLLPREEIALRLRYGIPVRDVGRDPVNRVAFELRTEIAQLRDTILYLNKVIDEKNKKITRLEVKIELIGHEPKEINASEYTNYLRSKYCPYCKTKLKKNSFQE